MLPIITRFLTPEDYGIIATFEILLAIFIIIVSLNSSTAMAVNFFKMDKKELRAYLGNIFFIMLSNFIITFTILFFIKTHLAHLIHFPENFLPLAMVVALANSICILTLSIWQLEQKPFHFGLTQVFMTILNLGFSIFFIIILNWDWQGRVWGISISTLLVSFFCFSFLKRRNYIDFSLKKSHIKDIIYIGAPLIPHVIGSWIITATDRFFINAMVGVAATGLYTVGYQVGTIIHLLMHSFNNAWVPFLYKNLQENKYDMKVKIVKLTYIILGAVFLMAVFLSYIAPYFLHIFVGKAFQESTKFVIWIALASAANGMYYMYVNYILYVKKSMILSWITLSSAVINVILNYFLIKANGAIGAAQATTITAFVILGLVWVFAAKYYSMPWLWWRKNDEII